MIRFAASSASRLTRGLLCLLLLAGAIACGDDPAGDGDQPTAEFSWEPTEPVAGDTVTFDGSGSSAENGTVTDYEWQFGDGFDGSGEITQNAYDEAGDYTVVLTVTDEAGNTDSTRKNISVAEDVEITAEFDWEPQEPTAEMPITFDGSDSSSTAGEIVTWAWEFGNGESQDASDPVAGHVSYREGGDYDVTLEVTDEEGNSASTTKTLSLDARVRAQFDTDPTLPWVDQQTSVDGTDSDSTDGEIVAWNWDFAGQTDSGETVEHTFDEAGVRDVELQVEDEHGDTATNVESVRVAEATEAVADVAEDYIRDLDMLQDQDGDLYWAYTTMLGRAHLYRSTDGDDWNEVETVDFGGISYTAGDLLESDDGDLFWAVGIQEDALRLYRSTDGGDDWNEMALDDLDSVLGAVSVELLETTDGELLWALGENQSSTDGVAALYRSTDDGDSWNQLETVTTPQNVRSISLLEDQDGDLYWSFLPNGGTGGAYLYRSTNGGDSWHEQRNIAVDKELFGDAGDLLESDDGDLYWSVVTTDAIAYLYRSTDGGDSWSEARVEALAGTCYGSRLHEAGDHLYWTFTRNHQNGTDTHLYRSTDGGETWSEDEVLEDTVGAHSSLTHHADSGLYWAPGIDFDYDPVEEEISNLETPLYRSTDGGENWTRLQGFGIDPATFKRAPTHTMVTDADELFWAVGPEEHANLYRATLGD